MRTRDLWLWAGVALAALWAAGVTLYATGQGVSITPDSILYLEAADHVARGEGPVVANGAGRPERLTKFPPGYPVALGGWLAAGRLLAPELTAAAAARALQILLTAINAGLLAWLVGRAAGGRVAVVVGGLAGIWLTVPLGFAEAHVAALSESLTMLLLLLWLAAAARWVREPAWRWLGVMATLATAAVLVRFAGASLALAAGTVVLLRPDWGGWSWPKRLAPAVGQGLPALVAAAAWILSIPRGTGVGGSKATGVSVSNEFGLPALGLLPKTTLKAIWPYAESGLWPGVYLLLAAGLIVVLLRRDTVRDKPTASPTVAVTLQFVAAYLLLVWLSAATVDPYVRFDRRLAVPPMLAAVVAGAVALGRRSPPAAMALLLVLAVPGLPRALHYYDRWRDEGMHYNTPRFRDSPAGELIATLPGPVWADEIEPVRLLSGRAVRRSPSRRNLHLEPAELERDVRVMLDEAAAAGGGHYVILRFRGRPDEAQAIRDLLPDPRPVFHDAAVSVYRLPSGPASEPLPAEEP